MTDCAAVVSFLLTLCQPTLEKLWLKMIKQTQNRLTYYKPLSTKTFFS